MNLGAAKRTILRAGSPEPALRQRLMAAAAANLAPLALIEIGVPALLPLAALAEGAPGPGLARLAPACLAGATMLVLTRSRWIRTRPLAAAAVSSCISAALLGWASQFGGRQGWAAAAALLFAAVSLIPFQPARALGLGCVFSVAYAVAAGSAASAGFLLLAAALAAVVAAANLLSRRADFEAGQERLRAAETLAGAQLRAQLAENAASIGKMAAALSHELNSPLGALRSSIDTLLAIVERSKVAAPEAREHLDESVSGLGRSIAESAARIQEVTHRLGRLVSLEEEEIRLADLNDLLADAALLHGIEIRPEVKLTFDLSPLPQIACRPQLLRAAFSSLLRNAIEAVGAAGRIGIATRRLDGEVEITFRDDGRGMSPDQAENAFDPSFKVDGNRISSGNWSLFNSRQIVYEHGGDIRIETSPGEGATLRVVLPLTGPAAATGPSQA